MFIKSVATGIFSLVITGCGSSHIIYPSPATQPIKHEPKINDLPLRKRTLDDKGKIVFASNSGYVSWNYPSLISSKDVISWADNGDHRNGNHFLKLGEHPYIWKVQHLFEVSSERAN